MKCHSVQSQQASLYLARRHKLYKTYQMLQIQVNDRQQHQQNYSTLRFIGNDLQQMRQKSYTHKRRILTIQFSEYLNNDYLDLNTIKQVIKQSSFVGSLAQPLSEILFIAFNFQPAQKISTVAYYLCRKSQNFKKNLIKKLEQLKCIYYKQIILISDMFLYGVYLTQKKYMQKVVEPLFINQKAGISTQKQAKISLANFFKYIIHYFQPLMNSEILIKKNRDRIIWLLTDFLLNSMIFKLEFMKKQLQQKLIALRKAYTYQNQSITVQTGMATTIIDGVDIAQNEQNYIKKFHDLQAMKFYLRNIWTLILSQRQRHNQLEQEFIDFVHKLRQMDIQFDLQKEQQTKITQQLLILIKNSCINYKNRKFCIKDQVYDLGQRLKFEAIIPTIQCPIPVIDSCFYEMLNNCGDIDSADKLAITFLSRYNKQDNRKYIVWQVFKKMSQRNNISYIIRVLARINQVDDQVKAFVCQKIDSIRNKTSLNIEKNRPFPPKYFKEYSYLIAELCKFQMHNTQLYLQDLLKQIENKHQNIDKQNLSATSLNISTSYYSNYSIHRTAITVTEIVDFLSKLGREAYYYSLKAHILVNQIIDIIYDGIRNSYIAYDIETISRFNAIVSYFRDVYNQNINSTKIQAIPLDEIKEQKRSLQFAKKYAKILKDLTHNKQTVEAQAQVSRISDIIESSIESNDFLSSYYYADFVYKVNQKKLNLAIFQKTQNVIIEKLEREDYQGAANWARFSGELYSFMVITQNQLFKFLEKKIISKFIQEKKAAVIKIVCAALETCKHCMIKTRSVTQISESLYFLLRLKKQILILKGIKNAILEQQIAEIMQYFHPALIIFATVSDIQQFYKQIKSYNEIQYLMDMKITKNSSAQKYTQKKKFKESCGKLIENNVNYGSQLEVRSVESRLMERVYQQKPAKKTVTIICRGGEGRVKKCTAVKNDSL